MAGPWEKYQQGQGGGVDGPWSKYQPATASQPPSVPGHASLLDMVADSPIGGFVRGARDVVDGGAQLLTRGLEAIAPAGSSMEKFMREERQRVEAINNAAEADYRNNWRRGQDTGLDLGRVAGGIAASAPLAAVIPGAGAATMLPRVGAGVAAGAVGGAVQPVDMSGQPDDNFWSQKGVQVAIGGGIGSLTPFIANGIGRAAENAKGRMGWRVANEAELSQRVANDLASRGVDFGKLSEQTQQSLLADARKALMARNVDLNPDALARKADFEALGIKPTAGQLTRDPMQYQFEMNTRGITGAGEGLSNRFAEQNTGLISALNNSRAAAGGQGLDRFQAGDEALNALRGIDAERRAGVDALYSAAREQAGIHTPLNPATFSNSVNDALDQAMLGDALPAGVRSAMNQIAEGKLPFTIQKAEQVRAAINGQMSAIPSRENAALRIVNNALQDAIDREGSAVGQQAGEAFKAARAAAADRFSKIDGSPAMKAAIDGAAPDDFVKRYVVSGKAGDLMALRADLGGKHPSMWNEMKGQVLDWLTEKALNGAADEYGKFSQSAYNKALNQIGNAKMKILFTPDEIAHLQRVGRVSAAIQVQPPGAAVNNSGTSQAVANFVSRAAGLPYLREMVINPAKTFITQGKVNAALNPGASVMAQPAAQTSDFAAQIARRFQLPLAVGGYPAIKGLLE